jgi:hypothetical protein
MKELWLVYNPLQGKYVYYEGKQDSHQQNRHEWSTVEEMLSGLRDSVNFDRKSFLHLTAISGDVYGEIHRLLKDTKISLGLEKKCDFFFS